VLARRRLDAVHARVGAIPHDAPGAGGGLLRLLRPDGRGSRGGRTGGHRCAHICPGKRPLSKDGRVGARPGPGHLPKGVESSGLEHRESGSSGLPNVGEGRLEFIEPFPANNQVTFKLDPSGTGTRVTWSLSGPNTLMGKEMSPFMDGFIGKSMEQGLAALDTAAQAEAKKLPRSSQAQAR